MSKSAGGRGGKAGGPDLLDTMERCVAAMQKRAESGGVILELAIPPNPALLDTDATRLDELTRHYLTFAVDQTRRGNHLLVRLDVMPNGMVRLDIEEEPTIADAATDPALIAAQAVLVAMGGEINTLRHGDGPVYISVTLPGGSDTPSVS